MKQNRLMIIMPFVLSLLFLQACTSTKDRFKGKTAKPDQIYSITGSDNSGVWNTQELSVHFVYTSSPPDTFNLTGHISISEHITNTYSKIRRLRFLVSFLDKDRKVISTTDIRPLYSVNNNTPEKIRFTLQSTLPAEAVAFCFSYSGEFKGDSAVMDSLYIGQNPFR